MSDEMPALVRALEKNRTDETRSLVTFTIGSLGDWELMRYHEWGAGCWAVAGPGRQRA